MTGSWCRLGVVLMVVVAGAAGCGKDSSSVPTGPGDPTPTTPFTGNWSGTAVSGVSGQRLNIGVQMTQSGSSVTGPYSCSPATGTCLIATGTVTGTVQGNSLTASVTGPGGVIACSAFNGTLSGNSIGGTYGCTGGDTGTWSMAK